MNICIYIKKISQKFLKKVIIIPKKGLKKKAIKGMKAMKGIKIFLKKEKTKSQNVV